MLALAQSVQGYGEHPAARLTARRAGPICRASMRLAFVMDDRRMAGPALLLAHVPLGEVLPDGYAGAEGELRRLGDGLESRCAD
jgi:hypothetical protein